MGGQESTGADAYADDGGVFGRQRHFAADLSRFSTIPQSVRKASRLKIEEAMERFGYRPNLFAVNFNRRNPKTLGIVVPSLIDPFYAALFSGWSDKLVGRVLDDRSRIAMGDPEREAEAVATVMSLKVAGAIAIPLGYATREGLYNQMARLHAGRFPGRTSGGGRRVCRHRQSPEHGSDR